MNARSYLATAYLLIASALSAPPARAQTLEDALVSAYRTSPKLMAQRDQLKSVDEGVAQAHADWRPTISIQASDSYVNEHISGAANLAAEESLRTVYPGDSYGLTITQPIYRGGRSLAELRRAKASVKVGEEGLLGAEEEVLLAVIGDYLDLLRDQALLVLAIEHEDAAQRQADGIKEKYKGGEATRLDTSSATAALTDAQIARKQASAQLLISKLAFTRDTGLAPQRLTPVTPPIGLPTTIEEANNRATAQNFDVKMAEYSVREAEDSLEEVRGQGRPTISLQGTLLHQDGVSYSNGAERVAAASIQLKIPLYAGGTLSSQTRAARDALDGKQHLLEESLRTALAEASTALVQSEAASSIVNDLDRKQNATRVELEGVTRQMAAGERSLSDVIAAQESLFAVKVAAIEANRDSQFARYTLADSIGQLTAESLHLPVELYDPEKYLRKIAWGPGR